jgi:hypothetical protein
MINHGHRPWYRPAPQSGAGWRYKFCSTTRRALWVTFRGVQVGRPTPPISGWWRIEGEGGIIETLIDDLQARMVALKTQQIQSAAERDVLLPSVLDKAFSVDL